jgi:tetratricopeptide (TPR) repeat protein
MARLKALGYLPYLIIFIFSTAIYFNTLWNKNTSDDGTVLHQNKFTLKGLAGIRDIMTHDGFVGYLGEKGAGLVSGGRYRPLSIVSMAVEVQFFGVHPMLSHGINILLFSLTCLLLYHILRYLIPDTAGGSWYLSLPFAATLLFAGHPIHTEVVANIKGRDEIMGLLFSLLALHYALLYVRSQGLLHLILGSFVFFLALLSKENALTFIAIVPLTYYFFTGARTRDYVLVLALYLLPMAVFLYMRSVYTQSGLWSESTEILNNPFAYLHHDTGGYIQRYATVIKVSLLYFRELVFPHPLTHDYYYDQIPIIGPADPLFILSVLINIGLIIYAIIGIRAQATYSYAIWYYFITFSVVSNFFFQIGSLMNERFVYMASIGFCILIGVLLTGAGGRYRLSARIQITLLTAILLLYSVKTISRNRDWVDETILSITDARTSINSAKVQNIAGSMLVDLSDQDLGTRRHDGSLQRIYDLMDIHQDVALVPDTAVRRQLLTRAVEYLKRSLSIYPGYTYAWFTMGTASYRLHKNPQEAIACYQKAMSLGYGEEFDIWNNIGCIELENNMPGQARENFLKVLALKPDEPQYRSNLALAYGNMGAVDSALYWYGKVLDVKPNDAATYHKIGKLYGQQLNNLDMAIRYISKAIDSDPNLTAAYIDLGLAYNLAGRPDDAIRVSEQCIGRFPGCVPVLANIVASYRLKNNMPKVKEYEARIAVLTGGH